MIDHDMIDGWGWLAVAALLMFSLVFGAVLTMGGGCP